MSRSVFLFEGRVLSLYHQDTDAFMSDGKLGRISETKEPRDTKQIKDVLETRKELNVLIAETVEKIVFPF